MTILIKNTQLVDGTGRPPVKADVLVKNDKISAIGIFPNYKADETIEGMGAYLAPGFIDINTDSDHYLTLFDNPGQNDFLLQGITTIIGGHCGASLAPIIYGSLESLRKWTDIGRINVNWHTLGELFAILEKKKLGVNFGTLVGHATIRESIAGRAKRDLSKNEIKIFISILEKAMKEGAFGMSAGLGYPQGKEISYSEMKTLVSFIASRGGIYATHLRDEKENLPDSMAETFKIAKDTGASVLISHFRPISGYENLYREALESINKSPLKKKIHFDAYPFSESMVLLESFLPAWARKEEKESILKDIKSSAIRKKIMKELPQLNGKNVKIISAPGNEYLAGKSLKQFSKNNNCTLKGGIIKLMELTQLRAIISYENSDAEKIMEFLKSESGIVASDSASFKESGGLKKTIKTERSCRTFLKFLKLAEEELEMPIEKAVYKMTGLPAQVMNISDRGIVSDGYFADLVLFRDAKIREVIINGKRAVKDGKMENSSSGRILKRKE